MLYLIGLGLGDLDDIGQRGLRIARSALRVYFEMYTSLLQGPDGGIASLESLLGRSVIAAYREDLEEKAEAILEGAEDADVAVLVVGDPMAATTHSDLVLRARTQQIPVRVIHNASIVSAVGSTGLQVYRFGAIVSIVFWTEEWKPRSFAHHISANLSRDLHTLCLLDIRVREPSMQALIRGRHEFEPSRFMTIAQAAAQLVEIIENPEEAEDVRMSGDTICVGVARLGLADEKIVAGRLKELVHVDMGGPLHSLIVCGPLHPLELEFLRVFAITKSSLV